MKQQTVEGLIRKYISAWNESDPAARQAHLEAAWEIAGNYTDPMSHASNLAELDGLITGFQANNPGARFEVFGAVDHHHRYVRFYWRLHFADGREMTGMDYGEITQEGKLAKIVGFF